MRGPRKVLGQAYRLWIRSVLRVRAEVMLLGSGEVTLSGVRVPIGRHISPRILDALRRRAYEAAEMELLQGSLRPDDVVLEIGTGLGVLAAYCARRAGSDAVHTFEANADLLPYVDRLCELNAVAPSVSFGAVGLEAGEIEFFTGTDFWSGSLVRGPGLVRRRTVPVVALSELLTRIRPSYLIVDIEGAEHPLLVEQPLHGVRALLLERHPAVLDAGKLAELDAALSDQGFRVGSTAHNSLLYARDAAS